MKRIEIQLGDGNFKHTDFVMMGNTGLEKGTILYRANRTILTVESMTVEAVGSAFGEPAIKIRDKNGSSHYSIENRDDRRFYVSKQEAERVIEDIKAYDALPKMEITIKIVEDVYTAFMAKVNREEPHLNSFRAIEMAMINYTKETK